MVANAIADVVGRRRNHLSMAPGHDVTLKKEDGKRLLLSAEKPPFIVGTLLGLLIPCCLHSGQTQDDRHQCQCKKSLRGCA
jgi:hypothetical protein